MSEEHALATNKLVDGSPDTKKVNGFLNGKSGEKSSKRLLGMFLILGGFLTGAFKMFIGQWSTYDMEFLTLVIGAGVLLSGAGLFEKPDKVLPSEKKIT